MRWITKCAAALLSAMSIHSSAAVIAEREFEYPRRVRSSAVSEVPRGGQLAEIVSALTNASRDALLSRVLPSRTIAGDTWFDMRGALLVGLRIDAAWRLNNICLDEAVFENVTFVGAELHAALLRGCTFRSCRFEGVNADNAVFDGADFEGCTFEGANFRMSRLASRASFRGCSIKSSRFDNVEAPGCVFSLCDLGEVRLTGARLPQAVFSCCKLDHVDMSRSCLIGADFAGSKLLAAIFDDSDVSRAGFRDTKLDEETRFMRASLAGAFLGECDLSSLNISSVRWESREMMIGEEIEANRLVASSVRKVTPECAKLYAQAEGVYRALSVRYREAGQVSEYRRLRARSQEARLKSISSSGNSASLEVAWLKFSKRVDGFGTDPLALVGSFGIMVLGFAFCHMAVWLGSRGESVAWYASAPVDGELSRDANGDPVRTATPTPRQILSVAKGFLGHCLAITRVMLLAMWFSVECSFMFAEKVMSIPDFIGYLRIRSERLVPLGLGRLFVGLQALVGVLFFVLAARMVVMFVSA